MRTFNRLVGCFAFGVAMATLLHGEPLSRQLVIIVSLGLVLSTLFYAIENRP